MLDEIPVVDVMAMVWLLVVWSSYNLIMDRLLDRRIGLNQHMKDVRKVWMLLVLLRRQLVSRTFRAIRGHHEASGFADL